MLVGTQKRLLKFLKKKIA